MRFAEVFLRLGCALVAWMLLYTFYLWLAATHNIGCGPDADEMHRVLLGLAPFSAIAAIALRVTRPFAEIHRMMRWLGVPLLLLLPFGLRTVWSVFKAVNVNGAGICVGIDPANWQHYWAPVQLVALAVATYFVLRTWTEPGPPNAEPDDK
jgi:hypothetical protein